MTHHDHNGSVAVPFAHVIDPFIRACPGPASATRALRLVAYQSVKGILGLEPDPNSDGEKPTRLRRLHEVASALSYTPDHLSKEAKRYGYSLSLAIRWVTFLQGCALREAGTSQTRIARRLGFSDASSWSRFVRNLTGKTPTQLPHLTLSDWVVEARRRVFLVPYP